MSLRIAAISAACLMSLFLAGCGRSSDEDGVVRREGEPDYVRPADEALMNRAMQKARQTQSEFVRALRAGNAKHQGFAVKKGFPTPDGGTEHIWINEVAWNGAQFEGVVNNEPVDTKAVALGTRVTVKPEELSDWMYLNGNRLEGGYTVRVLHYQGSAEQQRAFTEQTGMQVPPIDF